MNEVLEEYGLDEKEFKILNAIVSRPNYPIDEISKITKIKNRDILKATSNLGILGMVHFDGTSSKPSWVPTQKGKKVRIELLNLIKDTKELKSSMEELTKQDKGQDKREMDDNIEEGLYLANIMEVCNFIASVNQLCNLDIEWIRILSVLKGMGCELTPAEIHAHMENSNLKMLELRLKTKTEHSQLKRDKDEDKWIDRVSEKPYKYKISKAGVDALELAIEDWKERL